ncbi:hypothetical protein HN51_016251, partial [Arachis hypogaea]
MTLVQVVFLNNGYGGAIAIPLTLIIIPSFKNSLLCLFLKKKHSLHLCSHISATQISGPRYHPSPSLVSVLSSLLLITCSSRLVCTTSLCPLLDKPLILMLLPLPLLVLLLVLLLLVLQLLSVLIELTQA